MSTEMRTVTNACPICHGDALFHAERFGDSEIVECPQCGKFKISGTWEEVLKNRDLESRQAKLQEAKRRASPGEVPYLGPEVL
jgi:uncharacterized Zn finger protein (UPF0148 family)